MPVAWVGAGMPRAGLGWWAAAGKWAAACDAVHAVRCVRALRRLRSGSGAGLLLPCTAGLAAVHRAGVLRRRAAAEAGAVAVPADGERAQRGTDGAASFAGREGDVITGTTCVYEGTLVGAHPLWGVEPCSQNMHACMGEIDTDHVCDQQLPVATCIQRAHSGTCPCPCSLSSAR